MGADQLAAARGTSAQDELHVMAQLAPMQRLVTEDEVAEAVMFLSGPASSAITGQDLNVSAGLVMN